MLLTTPPARRARDALRTSIHSLVLVTFAAMFASACGSPAKGGADDDGCHMCREGARSCDGPGVTTCELGPSGCTSWSASEPCSNGEVCSGGACVDACSDQCTEGAVQCAGMIDGTSTCERRASGCTEWGPAQACDAPDVCSGGQCVLQCTNQCTVGNKQCTGNGVSTCELAETGCTDWSVVASCTDGKVCSGGQCVQQCTNQCTAGAKQCSGIGNGVSTCVVNATGCTDWDTPAACTGTNVCSAGQCVPSCTNQCTLGSKQCAGIANGTTDCVLMASGCTGWDTAVACTNGTTCTSGSCEPTGPVTWQIVPSNTTRDLLDLWAANASDIWAVGDGGTILHYNGSVWTGVNSGTVSVIEAIWGAASNDIWAVSDSAEVLHFNGTQWTKSKPFPLTVRWLTDVWGNGPDDVWVVGGGQQTQGGAYRGIVAHWNGASWTLLPSTNPSLGVWSRSVWTSGTNNVWIASATGILTHLEGTTWTDIGNQGLHAMAGTGASNVWFAGSDNYSITHFDGTSLVPVTSPLGTSGGYWRGVFARTAADAWMVGSSGKIVHFDGATWALDPRAAAVPAKELTGVWALGANDVWATGRAGTIVHLAP